MRIIDRQSVLIAMINHLGKHQGVSGRDLVAEIIGHYGPALERELRHVITELRLDGHHICALPRYGYYIAENTDELLEGIDHLINRSKKGFREAYAMLGVSMPDLEGQLKLPT